MKNTHTKTLARTGLPRSCDNWQQTELEYIHILFLKQLFKITTNNVTFKILLSEILNLVKRHENGCNPLKMALGNDTLTFWVVNHVIR